MPAPRPLITMFTDAGYCPNTHRASYAVWAKTDGKTLRHSGLLRDLASDPNQAEKRALVNGVALVLANMQPEPGTHIIAQTDSLSSVAAFSGTGHRKKWQRERIKDLLTLMQAQLAAAGVTIEYRHVKGHKGTRDARSAVNTWCDGECRRWLREARRGPVQPATPIPSQPQPEGIPV